MDFVGHAAFIKGREKDLCKIAARTLDKLSIEELANDALLVVLAIEEERGTSIDWHSLQEQDLILKELKTKHVWGRLRDKKLSVSADQERTDHEGNVVTLIDRFQAGETADPLSLLEHRENEEKEKARRMAEDAILESYSESVAYTITLWHFDNIYTRVAAYLVIGQGTLGKRIARAAESLKVQSSLFDRIERISDSFMPQRGEEQFSPTRDTRNMNQWEWAF